MRRCQGVVGRQSRLDIEVVPNNLLCFGLCFESFVIHNKHSGRMGIRQELENSTLVQENIDSALDELSIPVCFLCVFLSNLNSKVDGRGWLRQCLNK